MPGLVKAHTATGQLEASVVKARLESEGIPVLLKYDSASQVFGITIDGLAMVDVLVPEEFAGEAKEILGAEATELEEDG